MKSSSSNNPVGLLPDAIYVFVYVSIGTPLIAAALLVNPNIRSIENIAIIAPVSLGIQLLSLAVGNRSDQEYDGIFCVASYPLLGWRGVVGLSLLTSAVAQCIVASVMVFQIQTGFANTGFAPFAVQLLAWVFGPGIVDKIYRKKYMYRK